MVCADLGRRVTGRRQPLYARVFLSWSVRTNLPPPPNQRVRFPLYHLRRPHALILQKNNTETRKQYLFCLVVDAVRTLLAAHGAAPHGDDLMAIDAEEKCAAEGRRQKRRQKRKDRKRAGKAQQQQQRQRLPSASGSSTTTGVNASAGGRSVSTTASAKANAHANTNGNANANANSKAPSTPSAPSLPSPSSGDRHRGSTTEGGGTGNNSGGDSGSRDRRSNSAESASSTAGSDGGCCEDACEAVAAGGAKEQKARVESSSSSAISCLAPGFGGAIAAKVSFLAFSFLAFQRGWQGHMGVVQSGRGGEMFFWANLRRVEVGQRVTCICVCARGCDLSLVERAARLW